MVENRLKEEKTVLDLKMAHLEANLKSKSQQLQERIDQVNYLIYSSIIINNYNYF